MGQERFSSQEGSRTGCQLEHQEFVFSGDKLSDRNKTLIDFSRHRSLVSNAATRQSKITYAAHILFLLDGEDFHRGHRHDL